MMEYLLQNWKKMLKKQQNKFAFLPLQQLSDRNSYKILKFIFYKKGAKISWLQDFL